MSLTVCRVETYAVDLPFRRTPALYAQPLWGVDFRSVRTFYVVTLASGAKGIGEGPINRALVDRAWGRRADELVTEPGLDIGLEMALYDAIGRHRGVPAHRLMGELHRDRVALCWSAFAMPDSKLVDEGRLAIEAGFRHFKADARPWFDPFRQTSALAEAAPGLELTLHFGGWLEDSARALPILERLERLHPALRFEEPIPYHAGGVGYRRLGERLKSPLAVRGDCRWSSHSASVAELVDGFVLCPTGHRIRESARLMHELGSAVQIELGGSELLLAYGVHLAAVTPNATLPTVTAGRLFAESIVRNPLEVENGSVAVPDGPGLGVEVDWELLESRQMPEAREWSLPSDRLLELRWDDGERRYFVSAAQCAEEMRLRPELAFRKGAVLEELPNDGSDRWYWLQEGARRGPIPARAPAAQAATAG